MHKPTRAAAIAYAQERLRGLCADYPGGANGLLADIACLSVQSVKNLGREGRKKKYPADQNQYPQSLDT